MLASCSGLSPAKSKGAPASAVGTGAAAASDAPDAAGCFCERAMLEIRWAMWMGSKHVAAVRLVLLAKLSTCKVSGGCDGEREENVRSGGDMEHLTCGDESSAAFGPPEPKDQRATLQRFSAALSLFIQCLADLAVSNDCFSRLSYRHETW